MDFPFAAQCAPSTGARAAAVRHVPGGAESLYVRGAKMSEPIRQAVNGLPEDINDWMALVTAVRRSFPGLETAQALDEHRATVLRFMAKGQALCVRDGAALAGVLLYSVRHNMICCLAVAPAFRRRGIASLLMTEALRRLDRTAEITVSTFRAGDEKGAAPRALYKKFGFGEGALTVEMGYPCQQFVLSPAETADAPEGVSRPADGTRA